MNSSVTWDRATSVMSSLCLEISAEQEVERALEDVKVDLESARAWGLCGVATRIAGHARSLGPAGLAVVRRRRQRGAIAGHR